MSEDSYEEENLDDFMSKAADILSQKSSKEKKEIIESLKLHLSSIYENKAEMDNFFKTLNSVIFSEDLKLKNKQAFILYPIIFAFNPKSSVNFFYFFLDSLQISIAEENKNIFTFLSEIFSEVVQTFFNEKKKNIINKSYLIDKKEKNILFEKIMEFCEENIKTNKKLEQSFGCLILTDFIEKCPLVKDPKYLDIIFNKINNYLDDRWFECKLDLLNCTISLVFSAENKFKPYANTCLFRVMDYLTDTDWMMRKLAINIVYTLVFYCKEEILAVKENIIEFLTALKEDENEEIKEVCKQILEFILNDSNNDINNEGRNNEDNPKVENTKTNDKKKAIKKQRNENEQEKTKGIKNNDTNIAENNKNNGMEELDNKINMIIEEIKKIKEEQEKFKIKLENLIQKEENNYYNLNERFKIIEQNNKFRKRNKYNNNFLNSSNNDSSNKKNNISNYSENNNKSPKEKIKPKLFFSKQYEDIKIENLKNDFINGKYNEALLESKQNDKYLLELLPFMKREIIPKIEIAILEDCITRLNKRILRLCLDGDWEYISDILMFYLQLLNSKKKLKIIIKLSIKDAMNFLKSKGNNFLEENDINNIETIINTIVKA